MSEHHPEPLPPATGAAKPYTLLDAQRRPYLSPTPGHIGGHRGNRIYGRLDCRAALHAIAAGGYIEQRVFFDDEETAAAAGYRPCAICMPDAYKECKQGAP